MAGPFWLQKPLFGALSWGIFTCFLQFIRIFWEIPSNFWISKELLNCNFHKQMWLQRSLCGALSWVIFTCFLQYIRNFNWISKDLLNCALLWANVILEATVWCTGPCDIYGFLQCIRRLWGIPLSFNWISKELFNLALLWANVTPEAIGWRTELGDMCFCNIFVAFEEFYWTSTGYLKNCLIVHFYEQVWLQKPLFGALSRMILILFLHDICSFWRIPLNISRIA